MRYACSEKGGLRRGDILGREIGGGVVSPMRGQLRDKGYTNSQLG